MSTETNVLVLVKGNESYIFLYPDSQKQEALRTFGRFAANPELSFSWYDAAILSDKIRKAHEMQSSGDINANKKKIQRLRQQNENDEQ